MKAIITLCLFGLTLAGFTQAVTLHFAIQQNDINKVSSLLENGYSVQKTDRLGNTALNIAVYKGNIEMVKLLLQYGADINQKDEQGNTPLLVACYTGRYNICKHLIDQGADLNEQGSLGQSPVMQAVISPNKTDKLSIVRQLVQYGADINLPDNEGNTALDYCRDAELNTYLTSMGAIKGKDL